MAESQYRLARRVRPGQTAASYREAINATPPEVAFSPFNHAGFSTCPQPGHLDQLRDELAKQGNPPWASSEGTPMPPELAEKGGPGRSMEGYLGNLFNHGARLVNIFGWGVGDDESPVRSAQKSHPLSVFTPDTGYKGAYRQTGVRGNVASFRSSSSSSVTELQLADRR